MEIIIIAAIGLNNELGKDNNLLWKLPEDMKFFKETTEGHTVIMGRKTYESIPKMYRPLKGRRNIVITKNNTHLMKEGVNVAYNLYDALGMAENLGDEKVYIIGGATVYERAMNLADKMLITHVDESFDADTFFPKIDVVDWYSIRNIFIKSADDKHKYKFKIKQYTR